MPYGETISSEDRAKYSASFVAVQGEFLYTFLTVNLEPESGGITGSDDLFQEIIDLLATIPGLTLQTAGRKAWSDHQDVTLTPDE